MTGGIVVIPDQFVKSRMVALTIQTADVATNESTSSSSYTNLTTTGPAVTITSLATQQHLLSIFARILLNTNVHDSYASVAVNGATALDADGAYNAASTSGPVGSQKTTLAASQASGNTHTMKYRASSNSTNFIDRRETGVAA